MPLLWLCLAFLAGAVVPVFYSIPIFFSLIAFIVFVLLTFLEIRLLYKVPIYRLIRKTISLPLILVAAGFSLGMLRGEMGKPSFTPADLGFYHGKPSVTLIGVVSKPVEIHDQSSMLTLSASEVFFLGSNPIQVKGNVMLLLPAGSKFSYGDRLEIVGKMDAPPEREDFSYRQYLENQGVFSYMAYPRVRLLEHNAGNPLMAAIYITRDAIANSASRIVPQPQAAFLSGILVGRDEGMPDSLKNAFKATGTSHLVAISGFNITILSILILGLTRRMFTYGWAVLSAILLVAGYSIMAGGNPAVVRAAIMGGLAMVAKSIGRTKTAVNGLALTSAIMVAFHPLILRDIGFQLSVLATAGILVIGGPVNDWFLAKVTRVDNPPEINTGWSSVGEFFIITLAAQVATLPVLLFNFHRFPLIGLVVNPLVLPVQSAAMILGGIAALGGIIFVPLGTLLGWLAWIPLAFTTRVVELFAGFGNSGTFVMNMTMWQAAAFGLILVLSVVFWKKLISLLWQNVFILGGAVLVGILAILLNAFILYPDGKMHIEVFRQGNDLSTFILSPGGQRILVTNKPGDKDLIAFTDRRLPLLQKSLDAIFIPNPTTSSATGLADSLLHFQPKVVYLNQSVGGYRVQNKMTAEFKIADIGGQDLYPGTQFNLGGGAILDITQIDESGIRMDWIWGSESNSLIFGTPALATNAHKIKTGPVKVVILDHPLGRVDSLQSGEIVLVASPQTLDPNIFSVPDASWLEIISDGKKTELFKPGK